ncbi:DUF5937 family protein [Micromonospora sp. NPDC048830]|uniref:ArsR/SmtB family transcription factor n=1 Tax=Micromonospora sp. NPDC048830 TaxID=3364257 RepID=UPI00371E4C0A
MVAVAVTVSLAGLRANAVVVRVDPLAELGSMLHAITHGDHHPRGQRVRGVVYADERQGELLARARHFLPLYGAIRARYLMPVSLAGRRLAQIEDRLDELGAMDLDAFVEQSAPSLIEFSRDIDVRHLRTDCQARREFFRRVERLSLSRLELAVEIVERPAAALAGLRDFLHAVTNDWFHEEWVQLASRLVDDARRKENDLARRGVSAIVSVSPTAALRHDPDRVVFDKVNQAMVRPAGSGLIVVPSFYLAPHLIIKHDPGLPVVIAYAIGPAAGDGLDVTMKRLSALHDGMRIQICRAILRTPRTTVDLAHKMRMTEPQVSRHLRALREAELVTAERRGRHVYYSLETQGLSELGTQVLALLYR